MADIVVDGQTVAAFVPTIASATLVPTAAELLAGTRLETQLIAAGLEGFDPSSAEIDNTSLASTFDTKLPGRTSFSGTALVLKKATGTDTVHSTLSTPNTSGYIVIRDGTPVATAFAAAQKVAVYPVMTGQWAYQGRGEANSVLRYRVPLTVTAAPNLQATVT
jgi:hypothetical protein